MSASRYSVTHNSFRAGLRILFTTFWQTKTQLWKLMWAISGCYIGSSGSPLHQPLKSFFKTPLCRLLCNAMIQPLFDYACRLRLKLHLQVSQNKCMCFSWKLDIRSKTWVKEFLQLNWLTINDRYWQFVASNIFKFHNNQYPDYFD